MAEVEVREHCTTACPHTSFSGVGLVEATALTSCGPPTPTLSLLLLFASSLPAGLIKSLLDETEETVAVVVASDITDKERACRVEGERERQAVRMWIASYLRASKLALYDRSITTCAFFIRVLPLCLAPLMIKMRLYVEDCLLLLLPLHQLPKLLLVKLLPLHLNKQYLK